MPNPTRIRQICETCPEHNALETAVNNNQDGQAKLNADIAELRNDKKFHQRVILLGMIANVAIALLAVGLFLYIIGRLS